MSSVAEGCLNVLSVMVKGTLYLGPNWAWMIISGFLPAFVFWPLGSAIWLYSLMSCERYTAPMRLLHCFLFVLVSMLYMPGLVLAIFFGGAAFSYIGFMDTQKSGRHYTCCGWEEMVRQSWKGAGEWTQTSVHFTFDQPRTHRRQLLQPGEMPLGVTFGDLVFYVVLLTFGLTVFYPLWTLMNILKFLPATLSWYYSCGGEFTNWLTTQATCWRGCWGLLGFIFAQPVILLGAVMLLVILQLQGFLFVAGSCVIYTNYKDRTLGMGWFIAVLQMHDRRSHRATLDCFGSLAHPHVDRSTGIPSWLTRWWPCEWWCDPELHNPINSLMFL